MHCCIFKPYQAFIFETLCHRNAPRTTLMTQCQRFWAIKIGLRLPVSAYIINYIVLPARQGSSKEKITVTWITAFAGANLCSADQKELQLSLVPKKHYEICSKTIFQQAPPPDMMPWQTLRPISCAPYELQQQAQMHISLTKNCTISMPLTQKLRQAAQRKSIKLFIYTICVNAAA